MNVITIDDTEATPCLTLSSDSDSSDESDDDIDTTMSEIAGKREIDYF